MRVCTVNNDRVQMNILVYLTINWLILIRHHPFKQTVVEEVLCILHPEICIVLVV